MTSSSTSDLIYGAAPNDKSDKFWDRIAKRYARQPVADEAAYQRKLEVTRGYLTPRSRVLEIGCGTGSTALTHASQVAHIHAIDISANMIGIARDKAAKKRITNVTFEQSTIDALQVPDGSMDVVLGLSILHLLNNRDEVIARVRKMLKPGGVFITSTVCLGDTMGYFKWIGPIGVFFGLIPHVEIFTTDNLRAAMSGAGFDIEHEWTPGRGKAVFMVARNP